MHLFVCFYIWYRGFSYRGGYILMFSCSFFDRFFFAEEGGGTAVPNPGSSRGRGCGPKPHCRVICFFWERRLWVNQKPSICRALPPLQVRVVLFCFFKMAGGSGDGCKPPEWRPAFRPLGACMGQKGVEMRKMREARRGRGCGSKLQACLFFV